jgi:hypothetical protein
VREQEGGGKDVTCFEQDALELEESRDKQDAIGRTDPDGAWDGRPAADTRGKVDRDGYDMLERDTELSQALHACCLSSAHDLELGSEDEDAVVPIEPNGTVYEPGGNVVAFPVEAVEDDVIALVSDLIRSERCGSRFERSSREGWVAICGRCPG